MKKKKDILDISDDEIKKILKGSNVDFNQVLDIESKINSLENFTFKNEKDFKKFTKKFRFIFSKHMKMYKNLQKKNIKETQIFDKQLIKMVQENSSNSANLIRFWWIYYLDTKSSKSKIIDKSRMSALLTHMNYQLILQQKKSEYMWGVVFPEILQSVLEQLEIEMPEKTIKLLKIYEDFEPTAKWITRFFEETISDADKK